MGSSPHDDPAAGERPETDQTPPYSPKRSRVDPAHPTGGYDEVIHWPNGSLSYLLHGELHRADGPAFVGADGALTWLQHGREHRLHGPAVQSPDEADEYWIDGTRSHLP